MKEIRDSFEEAFVSLSREWREIAGRLGTGVGNAPDPGDAVRLLVRSAAKAEQTFGGINASLWDDPFEWTLPEAISSKDTLLEYLDEVDASRESGFRRISGDEDLSRFVPTPFGEMSLAALLLSTLYEAARLAGAARSAAAMPPPET